MGGCKNNLEKLSTVKVGKYMLSGLSMSTISSFKDIKDKHDVYRGKDCKKKSCECFKKHARKIIKLKKKKMKLLTNKQQESYQKAKSLLYLGRKV